MGKCGFKLEEPVLKISTLFIKVHVTKFPAREQNDSVLNIYVKTFCVTSALCE